MFIFLIRMGQILVLVGLLSAQPVYAQLRDCDAGQNTFKVFIDEPFYSKNIFSDDREMEVFFRQLSAFLDFERQRLWIETSDKSVHFLFCKGRIPSVDGHEFDKAVVSQLYNRGVILEIWSTLNARLQQGVVTDREAQINYLMMPVQFSFNADRSGPVGMHGYRYPQAQGAMQQSFYDFYKGSLDIDAFVSVGLGLKSMRKGDYDVAEKNFCKAKLLLQQVRNRDISPTQKNKLLELENYVSQSAGKTVEAAQQDSAYRGSLKLLNPQRPCP